jgi:hypothetical protein
MSNGRAKKGGEIGKNGEFYKGGSFLPSTQLPKQTAVKKQIAKPAKPLTEQQIDSIKKAIEGTKCYLELKRSKWESEGNKAAIDAHEAQIECYSKKISK